MTYVKIDQFDPTDVASVSPFDFRYSVEDTISRISRIGGYVTMLVACFAVVAAFIWLL